MTSLHDQFSEAEFDPVAQHFRGFRAFIVDDSEWPPDPATYHGGHDTVKTTRMRGALRSIYKREYRWDSGTNTAVCLAPKGWFAPSPSGRPAMPPHTRIIPECDCGFWAYTNGDHFLSVPGPAVLGIIEGWGRMVVGPYGFRAEKARIVALCFPETVMQQQQSDPPPPPRRSLWAAFNAVLDAIGSRLGALAAGSPPPSTARLRALNQPWQTVTPDLRAAVAVLYPRVPIFDSVAEMQRAYPLSDIRALLDDVTVTGTQEDGE